MLLILFLVLFIKHEQSILFEFNIKIEFWFEIEFSLLLFIKLFVFSFSGKKEKFEIVELNSVVIKL